MMIMIVIVIDLLRTNLSGLYRHRRGLGFTWSRLQGRKHNIRIAKLAFHAKESPTGHGPKSWVLYLHASIVRTMQTVWLSGYPLIQDTLSSP